MAVTLSIAEVKLLTGTTVTDDTIAVAKDLIEDQTGYTVDEHETRGIDAAGIKVAWAVVSERAHTRAKDDDALATILEGQGDYNYAEHPDLVKHTRLAKITDGYPKELLRVARATWSHV